MKKITKENLRDFVQHNKTALCASATAVGTALMSIPALASEVATVDLTTDFQNGLNSVSDDFMKYLAIAVPVALGIFGVPFAIKKGVAFFRGLAK